MAKGRTGVRPFFTNLYTLSIVDGGSLICYVLEIYKGLDCMELAGFPPFWGVDKKSGGSASQRAEAPERQLRRFCASRRMTAWGG